MDIYNKLDSYKKK